MVFYAGQFMTFERMMLTIGLARLANAANRSGLVRPAPANWAPGTKVSVLRVGS